jgi:hypothetical protein
MGVSGQRYAPAALPPGKRPPVPTVQEAGWASEPVWTQRLEKNNLPLPGIEPRSSGRPACSQTLYWLSYPAHKNKQNWFSTSDYFDGIWSEIIWIVSALQIACAPLVVTESPSKFRNQTEIKWCCMPFHCSCCLARVTSFLTESVTQVYAELRHLQVYWFMHHITRTWLTFSANKLWKSKDRVLRRISGPPKIILY